MHQPFEAQQETSQITHKQRNLTCASSPMSAVGERFHTQWWKHEGRNHVKLHDTASHPTSNIQARGQANLSKCIMTKQATKSGLKCSFN